MRGSATAVRRGPTLRIATVTTGGVPGDGLLVLVAKTTKLRLSHGARAAGVTRFPVEQMLRKRAGKRIADDDAADGDEAQGHPLRGAEFRRQRFGRESRDHRHQRPEDCAEEPGIARAHCGRAFLAPVSGIPERALVRPFDDLRRILGCVSAAGATENERMPLPELHETPRGCCFRLFDQRSIHGARGALPPAFTCNAISDPYESRRP